MRQTVSVLSKPRPFVSDGAAVFAPRHSEDDSAADPYSNDLDPAFLAALSLTNLPTQAGCRQGIHFDALVEEHDLGIPKVTESTLIGDTDEDFDVFVIDELASSTVTTGKENVPPKRGLYWPFRRNSKRSTKSINQAIAEVFYPRRSTDSSDGSTEGLSSCVDEYQDVLTALDCAPHLRMSFASTATTGTLDRYLAGRRSQLKAVEATLQAGCGMSILAYEREGSWLIEAGELPSGTDFICPFSQCEAHWGSAHHHVPPIDA